MRSSSKKTRLMTVEKVEGNDELLTTILVRLPPKSIFRFKCVSKRWNSILVDPFFHECYRARSRTCSRLLLGFIQNRVYDISKPGLLRILPIVQPNEQKIKQVPCGFTKLFSSSEGLILCGCYNYVAISRYFVVNPLNKTYIELPEPKAVAFRDVGLVCDENTQELAPSFRVVGIVTRYGGKEAKTMVIESYSSRTREWTTSKLVGTEDLPNPIFGNTFVCNGVLHWHAERLSIMVYDLNRDEKCVHLMKLPPDAKNDDLFLTRAPGDVAVWVGTSINESDESSRPIIKFWKLPKDGHTSFKCATTITEDQWILTHTINNDSLCKDMMLLLERKKRNNSVHDALQSKKRTKNVYDTVDKAVRVLKLEALIPSDPVAAVLSLRDKIFLYNLESKSLELVKYRGRPFAYSFRDGWHLFMESVSLSTYSPFPNAYN